MLVTGSNGFIGARVANALLQYGFTDLRCFVRPSSRLERLKEVLSRFSAGGFVIFGLLCQLGAAQTQDRVITNAAELRRLTAEEAGRTLEPWRGSLDERLLGQPIEGRDVAVVHQLPRYVVIEKGASRSGTW